MANVLDVKSRSGGLRRSTFSTANRVHFDFGRRWRSDAQAALKGVVGIINPPDDREEGGRDPPDADTAGRAARAPPDGYTLSMGMWGTHVVNPAIYALRGHRFPKWNFLKSEGGVSF